MQNLVYFYIRLSGTSPLLRRAASPKVCFHCSHMW